MGTPPVERKLFKDFDLIIVGSGPVGCVIAEQAARELDWKCLLLDKRSHIAGNCFDRNHSSGLLVHEYGPHYFRTNDPALLTYLSKFTEWIPGNFRVRSSVNGEEYPFPINLDTLEKFFKRSFTAEEARAFLEQKRSKIDVPRNSEEFVLSRVGQELYEAFYLGYTLKQWEMHPRDLDPSVCGRIPIRLNRDDRYVEHSFQGTPKAGFTELFRKMIDHPNIQVMMDTDYFKVRDQIRPRQALIYTGPIDAYFNYCFGKLQWRSLDFDFRVEKKEFAQSCVQINYPNSGPYTRSVEYKHITAQSHPETVVAYETPRSQGDPYYPVPTAMNQARYLKYKALADQETALNRVHFCGRLATYKYINTDEAIQSALDLFAKIKENFVTGCSISS
jgi:UDP-galactopyranose mutase